MTNPQEIFLKDYQPSLYRINKTHLDVDLYEDYAQVSATLSIAKSSTEGAESLCLQGCDLELLELRWNGRVLTASEYLVTDEHLTIYSPIESGDLTVVTKIYPQNNSSLEGLYKSRTMFCTQCEAEGFRKITYYLDRPDVMSVFTTKIRADKQRYPVLLSNGNLVASGDSGERHWVEWHDPYPKPSYLFALVAGNLECVEDSFVTCSGRKVVLKIFVEEKDLDKCAHAMQSLKHSMRWDEEAYGREYDLDIFMIVAVDDFNMGAMENKGLNIFNTSCVLAKPETTTDAEFQRVEAVVAHEYFHNWSGNRVTCRDWFQLSLKEGFTVFRDSQFSAAMGSPTVNRVEDVSLLRSLQFSEDAGPMAHPVQPASYMEISNFYTLTIYEKGAEIVRMIQTLLGHELFRQGSDLYFSRHDGQAVTIEDFVAAMAEVSGRDFSQFMHWYRQAGTPELSLKERYDAATGTLDLEFTQSCRQTRECASKAPYLIPMKLSLVGDNGPQNLIVNGRDLQATETVLEIDKTKQIFQFSGLKDKPALSLLRGFSAPVNLKYEASTSALLRIIEKDNDGFCRWDAAQQLFVKEVQRIMREQGFNPSPALDPELLSACHALLQQKNADRAMIALMLTLPSEKYLGELGNIVEVEAVHFARNHLESKLAKSLEEHWRKVYEENAYSGTYQYNAEQAGRRSLKNRSLSYLASSGSEAALALCVEQFNAASNMTDELAAFRCIVHCGRESWAEARAEVIERFLNKWRNEALVMNHWFGIQALAPQRTTLASVEALMKHPSFDMRNPNKVRALIGTFCHNNMMNFHEISGAGYRFLEQQIQLLNKSNPQLASRLLTPLTKWSRFDERRSLLMKECLENIQAIPSLSKDVFEIVEKSLKAV